VVCGVKLELWVVYDGSWHVEQYEVEVIRTIYRRARTNAHRKFHNRSPLLLEVIREVMSIRER
jgi:hypothetical protein